MHKGRAPAVAKVVVECLDAEGLRLGNGRGVPVHDGFLRVVLYFAAAAWFGVVSDNFAHRLHHRLAGHLKSAETE